MFANRALLLRSSDRGNIKTKDLLYLCHRLSKGSVLNGRQILVNAGSNDDHDNEAQKPT